ncbi:MAG: FAD-dependent oxidoreductase [Spirochaetales bacterium]|jgi:hypothetical protein|nr:FAD-dependent oxidoreductase [Spirochaetales bacterium]
MKHITYEYDFVVIGAGLAGIMAAVSASRHGLKTALVNDRPVPGGNAGKEIRIPSVGAANCNFFYSRESGLTEELLLENLYRNKTRNPEGWHLSLLTFLKREHLLDCYYNTYVNEVEVNEGRLLAVGGWTSLTEIRRTFRANYFADCTGDGTVGALAGVSFMMGTEGKAEFDELLAPDLGHPGMMGMSLHFHTVDTGKPMPYEKPEWVTLELDKDDFHIHRPGIGTFSTQKGGFWWIEWGGELDTVHETEIAVEKLNQIIYAIWDYLKNRSAIKDEIVNYEMDWVGTIPGKRESRRLIGDHILCQGDIDNQREFADAATYGGYGFDDHDAKGFFDNDVPSMHYSNKGPFNIPLRSLYSTDIQNLFLAGRDISATHIGLTATRVQYTCSQIGQAVGTAAAICNQKSMLPRELATSDMVRTYQRTLLKDDHHIHDIDYDDPENLAVFADIRASSNWKLTEVADLPAPYAAGKDALWIFPVVTDTLDTLSFLADVIQAGVITVILYDGPENNSMYPESVLATTTVAVEPGSMQWIKVEWHQRIARKGWYFMEVKGQDGLTLYATDFSPPGVLGCFPKDADPIRPNPYSRWSKPIRRELTSASLCFRIEPEQEVYDAQNITSPRVRPHSAPDLWISEPIVDNRHEWIELSWDQDVHYGRIDLLFDSTSYIHFAQTWTGNKTNVFPSLVKDYSICERDSAGDWNGIVTETGNYQRFKTHTVQGRTRSLRIEFKATNGANRIQVYGIRVHRSGAAK